MRRSPVRSSSSSDLRARNTTPLYMGLRRALGHTFKEMVNRGSIMLYDEDRLGHLD